MHSNCLYLPLTQARVGIMVRNYDMLCEKVSGLDPSVIVAAILSNGKVVANRTRSDIFIPEGKALEGILVQLEIVVEIPRTNENLYGKVGFVVINQGSSDHVLFPVNDIHIMIVSILSPYK